MEAIGVRVVDEEDEEGAEERLRLRKNVWKERDFGVGDGPGTGEEETALSLLVRAAKGEGGHEMGEGGTEEAGSDSEGVVVVMETGVAVPGVDEVEDEEGSRRSLLNLLLDELLLRLALSRAMKKSLRGSTGAGEGVGGAGKWEA
jgi:hypothetical protein